MIITKSNSVYMHTYWNSVTAKARPVVALLTGEPIKEDALMIFPYQPELVEEAGRHFDKVVSKIMARDFEVKTMPEKKVCAECDLREYCLNEGTLKLKSSRKN